MNKICNTFKFQYYNIIQLSKIRVPKIDMCVQYLYNDFDNMIQSRNFPDSDSQQNQDSFVPYAADSRNPSNHDNSSSQQPHNKYSQQHESSSQQSDGSYDEDEIEGSSSNFSKQESLQKQLLKLSLSNEQKRKPFQKQIMGDIVDKIKSYQEVARDKDGEELVTLRIQELVYNKLLVFTYGCSEFRLVLAHFHLGTAYLKHNCVEQSIEHISIAIHKNQKLFDELHNKNKLFHCIMRNILAECLIKKQEYDDAIDVLQRSIQLTDSIQEVDEDKGDREREKGESRHGDRALVNCEEVSNRARVLLTQCYCKHKEYEAAIRTIEEVLVNTKQVLKSQQGYAFALVQKANILAAKGDYNQAISSQDQAIHILIKINYPKPQDVAQMHGKLADYYQKTGNHEQSLSCIQKLKTLYQNIYSQQDKCVIKARRRIATCLLKNDRFKEAVNELLEIVELEEKVFGESSIQTARTLKLLGTVYIRLETGDARTYLKRAMSIFSAHGNKKQVEEIKEKLKMLMQNNNNSNQLKILSEQDL